MSDEHESTPGIAAIDWRCAPAFGRRETVLKCLRLLAEMRPGAAQMVETGTIRDGRPNALRGDGWSCVAWGWYAQQCSGKALVSRGVDDAMRERAVALEPKPGISAIIHTRNEAANIAACIEAVRPWVDEVVACDMDSSDDTPALVEALGVRVLRHPLVGNFDKARRWSAEQCDYTWVFYVDADERVPEALGSVLRDLIAQHGNEFEAVQIPYRTFFGGNELTGLFPGYKAPPLLKRGWFDYDSRLHQGPQIHGRVIRLAPDPTRAIEHYSYRGFAHYVAKMNSYTDTEAANLAADGQRFDWREMMGAMARDFAGYYDGGLKRDGARGLLYALASATYRLYQHAKLLEANLEAGDDSGSASAPESAEELLQYALEMVGGGAPDACPPIPPIPGGIRDTQGGADNVPLTPLPPLPRRGEGVAPAGAADAAESGTSRVPLLVVTGPVLSASGYGDECRNLILAAQSAGVRVAARSNGWSEGQSTLADQDGRAIERLLHARAESGFVQLVQDFPPRFQRDPEASRVIGRTMFETDRLPADWVAACNTMDRIWVPSEFNRRTFAESGVDAGRIAVIPGCIDMAAYAGPVPESRFAAEQRAHGRYLFLSVFDWTLRKGWDLLLDSFLREFEGRDDVALVLKCWSSLGYGPEGIQRQASDFVRSALGMDLAADNRIRFVQDRLPRAELIALYRSCDAFELPSRGEGWGLPSLEAMACGLPTIGTDWGGSREFMTPENSYLIACSLEDVPEEACREAPAYRGHRWAEPRIDHLRGLMRQVYEDRGEASERGARGQAEITERFDRGVVGRLVAEELAKLVPAGARCISPPCSAPLSYPSLTLPASGEGMMRARRPLISRSPPATVYTAAGSVNESEEPSTTPASPAGAVETAPLVQEGRHARCSQPSTGVPIRVALEGPILNEGSLAHVNCALCTAMLKAGGVELTLQPTQPAEFAAGPELAALAPCIGARLRGPTEVTIRHGFPPRFEPAAGRLILIQPWEFGALPKAWIEPIRSRVDEVWCPSRFVREIYVNSGIAPEKVFVVPNGVDTSVFHPGCEPYQFTREAGTQWLHISAVEAGSSCGSRPNPPAPVDARIGQSDGCERAFLSTTPVLQTKSRPQNHPSCPGGEMGGPIGSAGAAVDLTELAKPGGRLDDGVARPYMFLYVGGTIHRKGADLALAAYRAAFRAGDDVCLVVKDTCTRSAYRGANMRDAFLAAAADSGAPPVIYLDDDLSAPELARLYAACDCLVAPYRGEGFCLPALEAMACGLPVIATAGGATDDFLDDTVAWRIPAERRWCDALFTGEWECVERPWMLEPSMEALIAAMRAAAANPDEGKVRGREGAKRAAQWTWDAAARVALERLAGSTDSRHSAAPMSGETGFMPPLPPDSGGNLMTGSLVVGKNCQFVQSAPPESGAGGHVRRPSGSDGAGVGGHSVVRRGSSPRPRISLCMIVKDEERVLRDCLASVKPWVDEMIVVDTGSTDRTREIAREMGARVEFFAWCDSFSAARNESIQYATGDWILWVDADDTMSPESGIAIRQAAEMTDPGITGFVIPVQFVDDDGKPNGTRVDHVKLFRNLPGLRFEGRLHEQIMPSLRRMGGQVARCPAVVLHTGYDTSIPGQAKKRTLHKRLLMLDLQDQPNHPFLLFNAGMEDHFSDDHESAIAWLRKSLAVSTPEESHVRKAYALMAVSQRVLGDRQGCLDSLAEGLRMVPGDPEMHFQAGLTLTGMGRFPEARDHYLQVLKTDISAFFSSIDMGILGYKTFHNLGSLCWEMKRYEEARDWWRKAVADSPQFLPSATALFAAALDRNDYETAAEMGEAVRRGEGPGEGWAGMAAQLEERRHGTAAADACLQALVASEPEAPGPRMVLARRLLRGGLEPEAEPHLEVLLTQGVAEAHFYRGVSCVRRGDYAGALGWMERALELNPVHEETRVQVDRLRLIAAEPQ